MAEHKKKREKLMAELAKEMSTQKDSFAQASLQSLFAGLKIAQSRDAVEASEELFREQEDILKGNVSERNSEKKDFLFRQSEKAADTLMEEIKRLGKASEGLKEFSEDIQRQAEKSYQKMKDIEKDQKNDK